MRWKLVVMSLLIVCLSGMQPVRVVAQTAGDDAGSEFDRAKFFDYAMCGATIVFASGTGTWVLAAITCSKAITEHWTT